MFEAFWREGLLAYDAFAGIDWTWLALDGAMGKVPLRRLRDSQADGAVLPWEPGAACLSRARFNNLYRNDFLFSC